MRSFEEYRAVFSGLYQSVKKSHAESTHPHRGHGLDHDAAVAQMGAIISQDNRTADKVWVAGMCHSADRVVGRDDKEFETLARQHLSCLPDGYFERSEVEEVLVATLKHGEKNKDDDSLTLQNLKDSDRLINLQLLVVIRCGQFYPEIPPIELEHIGRMNPNSTFKYPCNSLDDLRNCFDWVDWLRNPEAKRRGEKLAASLRRYIEEAEEPFYEMGLAGVVL